VSRWTVRLADDGWGDTTLTLPDGEWTDRIAGGRYTGTVAVSELFGALPVALLEKASA
jgi:(1->4)-alpha-D-glucan 1-alpha-D-glucosylmutase